MVYLRMGTVLLLDVAGVVMFRTAHELYTSKEFRSLRLRLMNERAGADGLLMCEHCGKPIVRAYDCIAHHVEEVTAHNLNDMSVTLADGNIRLIHHKCHNEIHGRFGRKVRKVYMVWGAPRAGKNTFVESVRNAGDMVVDIDAIWVALGDKGLMKPDALKATVFRIRDAMYECVLMRTGGWENAYVITTRPDERLADRLGAELVFVEASEAECLERCADERWRGYVKDWFGNPPRQVREEV